MGLIIPGPSEGFNWERIVDVDYSLEATAPIPEGTNMFQDREIYVRNRGHNRDGLLQMVNGKGIKITPDSGANWENYAPGFQIGYNELEFIDESVYGNDPPIRCMMEVESYLGGSDADFVGLGFARNPWEIWSYEDGICTAGITSSGKAAAYVRKDAAELNNGVLLSRTHLNGRLFSVVESRTGFMSGRSTLGWANSADFNLARIAASFEASDTTLRKWANSTMSPAGSADYAHANPYIMCAAGGSSGGSTFYVKRLIVEIKRQ